MLTTMHNETFNSLIVHSGTENTPAGDKDLWGCVHCQTNKSNKKFFGFFFFLIAYLIIVKYQTAATDKLSQ